MLSKILDKKESEKEELEELKDLRSLQQFAEAAHVTLPENWKDLGLLRLKKLVSEKKS